MDVLLITKLYHCFKYIKARFHLATALNIKFIKVFLSLFCEMLFVIENCDKKVDKLFDHKKLFECKNHETNNANNNFHL